MTPYEILASTMARFADLVDSGSALKVLEMCGEPFTISMGGQEGDISAFQRFLEMRQAAEYQTRHVVGFPTLISVSDDEVSGRVPVTAFRIVEGDFSIGVADFTVTVSRQKDQWRITRWALQPFILRQIVSESLL